MDSMYALSADTLGMSWAPEATDEPELFQKDPDTIEDLQEETTVLRRSLEEAKSELVKLRKELVAKTIQLKQEMSKSSTMQQKLKTVEKNSVHNSEQVRADAGMLSELEEAKETIQSLNAELTATKSQLAESDQQLQTRSRRLQTLEVVQDQTDQRAQQEHGRRIAVEQATDRELEAVASELHCLQDRTKQQIQQKDVEIESLMSKLANSEKHKARAVTAAVAEATMQLQTELQLAQQSAAGRTMELEEQVRYYRDTMDDGRGSTQHGRLVEELGVCQSTKARLQSQLDSMQSLTSASLQQKTAEVSRLVQMNTALQSELTAAKLAVQHSQQHVMQAFSIWSLPYILGRSLSLRGLSVPLLESNPELNEQLQRLHEVTHGCLPLIIIVGVVICLGFFLLIPRMIL